MIHTELLTPRPVMAPGRAAILRRLQERTAELVDETMRRIWTEIPAYAAVRDPAFRADETQHVHEHHQMVILALTAEAPVTREDSSSSGATRRAGSAESPSPTTSGPTDLPGSDLGRAGRGGRSGRVGAGINAP